MLKLFVCWFLFSTIFFAQDIDSHSYNDLRSPQNIKKFADFLFCSKDYLRAIEEYQNYLQTFENDTVRFKIGLSYSMMQKYFNAQNSFAKIQSNSPLYRMSKLEFYKASFQNDESNFRNEFDSSQIITMNKNALLKLYNYSFLYNGNNIPLKDKFLSIYTDDEKNDLKNFYNFKIDPPTKSPVLASILSAIIPGLGKIYSDQIGDGITSFVATGLLAFLAYDNFHANHKFRGWLFTGLGGLFYAGNIYGSAAAAQIYNAKLFFNFNSNLKIYLENKNYFIPQVNFCN